MCTAREKDMPSSLRPARTSPSGDDRAWQRRRDLMSSRARLSFASAVLLAGALAQAQTPGAEGQPSARPWATQKVSGRDAVLRDIEARAKANGERVVSDTRRVMYDFEIDLFRLVLRVGKRYGMDTAYEIMSEGVAEKRLRWLDQAMPKLQLSGTEVEKGLALYRAYFETRDDEFTLVELTSDRAVFRRKDYVNAIFQACDALGLDPVTVMNKVYAGPMTLMLSRAVPGLRNSVLKYDGDGWYEETIELTKPR
jgi:hypothetical protein